MASQFDDRIEINPAKCHGRAVIRGTRIPVSILTGSLAGGMTMEDVAREYDVSPEDIRAALAYVARQRPSACGAT